ncbi:hypothetical protein QL285_093428 [Trifolium repens]|nr:hypothetical protein QL285_093428 [Trifolium repens]
MLLYEIQKYVKEKCICTAAATGDWATASSYDKTHTVVWTTSSGMEGPPVPAVARELHVDGTVFVQCCGYHKLVDHLNLFQETNCYLNSSFNYKGPGWEDDRQL